MSKEVRIVDLVSFSIHSSHTYEGERLAQLKNSIERVGLMYPIIIRPIIDEQNRKYEIICGHNRTKAMKELGYDTILAEIRDGLSDQDAMALFYDSNLNQQSFSDWSYSEKLKAIKYIDSMIKENSNQGKRTDLDAKKNGKAADSTSVQSRHKLNDKPKRSTTRDKMARRLGIATATFSKYRSIIKLPVSEVESIGRLLDQKMITFEAAYLISGLEMEDIEKLMNYIENSPSKKIDMDKLKSYRKETIRKRRDKEEKKMLPFNPDEMLFKKEIK